MSTLPRLMLPRTPARALSCVACRHPRNRKGADA
jgi:hypothetical protein